MTILGNSKQRELHRYRFQETRLHRTRRSTDLVFHLGVRLARGAAAWWSGPQRQLGLPSPRISRERLSRRSDCKASMMNLSNANTPNISIEAFRTPNSFFSTVCAISLPCRGRSNSTLRCLIFSRKFCRERMAFPQAAPLEVLVLSLSPHRLAPCSATAFKLASPVSKCLPIMRSIFTKTLITFRT
jgi:hypothetical protein